MDTIDVAVIPGDGVGEEVTAEGVRVLEAAARLDGGFRFAFRTFPWSCAYYLEHGRMMPEDGLRTLADFAAIFLGAVGYPTVPDHISLWGLLLPIRRGFDQYVNLRPVELMPGVTSPLRDRESGSIRFVVIRENTEGEYSNSGGRLHTGTPYEVVVQNTVFTRMGTERIIRYAMELAERWPRRRITGATKSNGINHTMPFWDEVFRAEAERHPSLSAQLVHIDALCAFFVTRPDQFDVVVASNLFGDILTDLGAAIQGSIGVAASANLDPERRHPSMFEAVHGSAPDIAGQGIANPVGQIMSARLMLEHLGKPQLAEAVGQAVRATLAAGVRTRDLGGSATTREVGDAVVAALERGR